MIEIDIIGRDIDSILIEAESKEDKEKPSKPNRPEGFITPMLEIVIIDN